MRNESYLSIEGVAKRFNVNTTTIYRLVKRGKLPGFKIGNQWRFSEALLESWVADQVTVKWLMADEALPAVNRISVSKSQASLKSKAKLQ